MRRFADIEELTAAVGETLGESGWLTVTQEMIDGFAAATGDHQWIHVDRERAKASPFGTTIAHGYLTLSLIPRMIAEIYRLDGAGARLNYGCNKVRFTQPVPSGSRVRTRVKLLSVDKAARGVRAISEATVEIEGARRPACVAELIVLVLPE